MAVITISRHFGAGGRTIGEMVSEKLEYSLFDNELIQMVAVKAKVSEDIMEAIDNESGGKLQKAISGFVPKRLVDLIGKNREIRMHEEIYVDLLEKIIREIANEGNAVIIGRGGQYILKGREDVYNILILADMEDRRKFVAEKFRFSTMQAAKTVDIDDKRRAALYRKFGKDDYDQPELYHLVLNTSRIDMDTASELICELVQE